MAIASLSISQTISGPAIIPHISFADSSFDGIPLLWGFNKPDNPDAYKVFAYCGFDNKLATEHNQKTYAPFILEKKLWAYQTSSTTWLVFLTFSP